MNKKFSTLVASFLLATAFGTVQASDAVKENTPCGAGQITGADFDEKEQLDAKQFYFVQNEYGKFLSVVEGNGFQAELVDEPTSLDALNHALWKIEPQVTEDGGVTRFVLTNKATGLYFAYDPTVKGDDENLGGAYPNWKWFDNKYSAFGEETELTVVFEKGDKTMYLAEENGVVVAKKVATKEFSAGTGLKLKIVKAGTYTLTAKDLNKETSKAGVKYMQLNFGDENENNIFAEKYQAQEFDRSVKASVEDFKLGLATAGAAEGWTTGLDPQEHYLVLNKISDKGELTNQYVHIDTAYYASKGESFKLYNTISVSKEAVAVENNVLTNNYFDRGYAVDAYRFQFVKNLANDKVWVRSLVEAVELSVKTEKSVYNDKRDGAYTKWAYATEANPVTEGAAEGVNNGAGQNVILSHCTLEGETEKVITFYTCDEGKPAANYVNLMAIDGVSQNYTTIPAGVYVVS
ncbi:MAG: hypothetical protein ACI3ZY_03970, partial [Parabacteroides sp.]